MATSKILLCGKYSGDFEKLRSELTRSGYEVLTSREQDEALRIVNSTRIELVLSDISLEKGNGIDLCWAVRNLSRRPSVPFVILTEIKDEEVRLNAYRAGVNLYLVKPISLRSLSVRLEALLNWRKRMQQYLASSSRSLAGVLQEISLLDLVQLLNMEGKTGALWLSHGFARGMIYFEEGEIRFAKVGKLEGEEAFYAMGEWKTGSFDFESGTEENEVNIHIPTVKLILECSKRTDETQESNPPVRPIPKKLPPL